jgi:hypothetical protein
MKGSTTSFLPSPNGVSSKHDSEVSVLLKWFMTLLPELLQEQPEEVP